jgi:hypothetical protein
MNGRTIGGPPLFSDVGGSDERLAIPIRRARDRARIADSTNYIAHRPGTGHAFRSDLIRVDEC